MTIEHEKAISELRREALSLDLDYKATLLRAQNAEAALAALREKYEAMKRLATDREYMMVAYYNMLGPVATELADAWAKKGMKRIHFDWTPEAFSSLTGEQRAEFIRAMETAPWREVLPGELD